MLTELHALTLTDLYYGIACLSNNRVSVEIFQRDIFFSKTETIYRYNYIIKIRSKKKEKQIVSISIYKIGQLS